MPAVVPKPHVIEDEGTPLGFKPKLNFVGAGVTVTNQGNKTVVNIPGAGPPQITTIPGFVNLFAEGVVPNVYADQTAKFNAAQDKLLAQGGGKLYAPPCQYFELQAPVTIKDGVNLECAGSGNTTIAFNLPAADTGVGTYCFQYQANPSTNRAPSFKGFRLFGPAGSLTLGARPCGVSGIKLGWKSRVTDVLIERVGTGIAMMGDHSVVRDSRIMNTLHAIDYPGSGFLNHGNQAFYDCDLTGNMLSGVHCTGANFIDYCTFQNVHLGISPFGFLRDGSSSAGFLMNSKLDNCAWELTGNSAFADLSTNGQPSWVHNRVDGTGWSQHNSYRVASLPSTHAVYMPGPSWGGLIRQDMYPFAGIHFGAGSPAVQVV